MNKDLRIVFMGTPEFAVESLRTLVEAGWNIVGVITAVDKKAGRNMKLRESAVKQYAQSVGLPLLQPKNLKAPEFQQKLKSLNADLQIVVAFRMLPESVWSMPKLGTFNLHASKLPAYRGAAPIHWAIINGETQTGLTTFFLKHEIDTGHIIFTEDVEITEEDSLGTLMKRMKEIGAGLVLKTVEAIAAGNAPSEPQDLSGDYPNAPKLFRDNCKIDWNSTSRSIYNKVRGLCPFPGAWTFLEGEPMKLLKGKIVEDSSHLPSDANAGDWHFEEKALFAKTADGWYECIAVQLSGKKRMLVEEMLRGYRRKTS